LPKELLKECLSAQWDFLEWLRDNDCLSEKGMDLVENYWEKFIEKKEIEPEKDYGWADS